MHIRSAGVQESEWFQSAMTQKTVDRLGVVQQVVDRQLRQKEAARQLDLSVRQIPLCQDTCRLPELG